MVFLPARYKEQDVLITKSNELRLCDYVWKHIDQTHSYNTNHNDHKNNCIAGQGL